MVHGMWILWLWVEADTFIYGHWNTPSWFGGNFKQQVAIRLIPDRHGLTPNRCGRTFCCSNISNSWIEKKVYCLKVADVLFMLQFGDLGFTLVVRAICGGHHVVTMAALLHMPIWSLPQRLADIPTATISGTMFKFLTLEAAQRTCFSI